MKNLINYTLYTLIILLSACGGASVDDLTAKKEALTQKRKQYEQLGAEIRILEKEITKLDPKFSDEVSNATLVTMVEASKGEFTGYLEIQGSVKSDKNVILTAETNGIVRSVPVSEGQAVAQGQLLVSQDSRVLQNNIEEVKKALELAEIVFKKQENLWNQKIGTEIQYLEAKNKKESLEKQLITLRSQVGMANTVAPFSGVVDEIIIKPGQTAMPGTQLLKLVSVYQVNVVAEVSESYLGKINRGDIVKISFPSVDKEIEAPVKLIGQTINPENRTFRIEMTIPNADSKLKPDMQAIVKVKNFENAETVVVPTNLIQRDKAGEFVFIAEEKNNKIFAKKMKIERGETYNNKTSILSGLTGNEKLIDKGFREVVDGTEISIIKDEKAEKVANKL